LLRPPAGTVIFPRVTIGNTGKFVELLSEKYETEVVPGRFFEMPDHFRLGIGGDTEMLRAALERISSALDVFARK
jgi:aspartate/methionine/tyrosine aminotransferase